MYLRVLLQVVFLSYRTFLCCTYLIVDELFQCYFFSSILAFYFRKYEKWIVKSTTGRNAKITQRFWGSAGICETAATENQWTTLTKCKYCVNVHVVYYKFHFCIQCQGWFKTLDFFEVWFSPNNVFSSITSWPHLLLIHKVKYHSPTPHPCTLSLLWTFFSKFHIVIPFDPALYPVFVILLTCMYWTQAVSVSNIQTMKRGLNLRLTVNGWFLKDCC